jgi:peroxiredoxin
MNSIKAVSLTRHFALDTMKRQMKRAFIIIFLLFLGSELFGMGGVPKGIGVGKEAVDFKLQDLKGIERSLSDYKGKKVIFLNFWATWCPPCRREMPSMQILHEKFKEEDFVMLAVSLDSSKRPATDFIKEHKYTFTVLMDSDKKVARIYQITGIPTTFIIDQKGVIAHKTIGMENWAKEEILQTIEKLIK